MTNGEDYISSIVEHTDGSTMRLQCTESGLTKREYFAAMAMQGIIAAHNIYLTSMDNEIVSKTAVKAADALIAALNEK